MFYQFSISSGETEDGFHHKIERENTNNILSDKPEDNFHHNAVHVNTNNNTDCEDQTPGSTVETLLDYGLVPDMEVIIPVSILAGKIKCF